MTDAVIARIELLAVGQPSHPVFTDRQGRPIGDVAMEHFDYESHESDDELPGVHLPESDKSAEIPGARLHIPAGILGIPVFSVPNACF